MMHRFAAVVRGMAVAVALVGPASGAFAALSPYYQVFDLGPANGTSGRSWDISNTGYISGVVDRKAFLYENGVLTDISTSDDSNSTGNSVNDSGQVAITAHLNRGPSQAFLYSNGTRVPIGLPGSNFGTAMGINSAGDVVGSSGTSGGIYHGYVYHNGVTTDLGTLPGSTDQHSSASAINDSGVIVGSAGIGGTDPVGRPLVHAFRYENGVMADIGTLGGVQSHANDINASGVIVGQADSAAEPYNAFVYSNGVMTNLGALGGVHFSEAFGVNSAGDVVGMGAKSGEADHAFLYTDGVYVDLEKHIKTNYTLVDARAINDAGMIVGLMLDGSDGRAFLAVPVPEPAAVAIVAPVAVACVRRRRRR